jgi:hypothetical protein
MSSANPGYFSQLIVIPVIVILYFLPILLWWAVTIIYLYSIGTPTFVKNSLFPLIIL